ncbi:hypothetical protein Tco_1353604 [Tanacetum coccineum]
MTSMNTRLNIEKLNRNIVQKNGGSKQVGFKQLGSKQVGFKQLGPGVETGVHGVQVKKRVWFEVELQGAQGDREVEVFRANITVTGVPGQEGAEGNVAEKKKVKESMEANLGKLLKYNAWLTRRFPVRGVTRFVIVREAARRTGRCSDTFLTGTSEGADRAAGGFRGNDGRIQHMLQGIFEI